MPLVAKEPGSAPLGAAKTRLSQSCPVVRLLTAVIFLSALLGCRTHHDPQSAYDHARKTLSSGDLAAAAKETQQAYDEFHGLSAEWAWKFTILRARILYRQNQNEAVLKVLASETAPVLGELAIQKQRFEGLAYSSLHNFSEAEQRFTEADRLCAVSYYPACTDVVHARGELEMERGHYSAAQPYFERVLNSARAGGDRYWEANVLLDLSWSADEQTHFDEALDWANSARRISLDQNFGSVAQKALGNMGWAYYKLGETERAEGMFIEAKKKAEDTGETVDQVRWLTDLGYIYLDARKFALAQQSFSDSLKLAETAKSREDIINSRIALAFVYEQTNKLDDAKQNADEALKMAQADDNKRDQVYPRLVLGRIAAQQHDAATAEAAFHEVAEAPDAPVFLKWQAEHSLARLYEDEHQPDAADREYKVALSTFEAARKDLKKMDSRLPFLTNARAIYDDYINFLVARGKNDEALQVADFNRARTLSEGLGLLPPGGSATFQPYPLNAPQVARHAGGTILFYWLGQKQSYLWTITPQKTSLFTLPPAPEIEAAVQRYSKALTGPEDAFDSAADDGTQLYRMLVAPAQELLTGSKNPYVSQTRRDVGNPVFIIPDGSLNTLNFETLLVPDPQPRYWIEDATISNASSLRMLQAARHDQPRSSSNLLLFGDAVAAAVDYPPLPKAAAEMDQIAKHFPAAKQVVRAREQATAPAYLASKPEQYSYIHFVAHGTASRQSPLDSAIVLSKATEQDDSFKLYARDIIHHRLRADLVTISACYGAGTRAYSGEGLVGLSWAFLGAGAHNVIGALWEVSDVSTPQLMDRLYDELRKGKSPGTALRAAKLSLLHSNNAFR